MYIFWETCFLSTYLYKTAATVHVRQLDIFLIINIRIECDKKYAEIKLNLKRMIKRLITKHIPYLCLVEKPLVDCSSLVVDDSQTPRSGDIYDMSSSAGRGPTLFLPVIFRNCFRMARRTCYSGFWLVSPSPDGDCLRNLFCTDSKKLKIWPKIHFFLNWVYLREIVLHASVYISQVIWNVRLSVFNNSSNTLEK